MRSPGKWISCLVGLMLFSPERDAEALGLSGLGLKVGVDLTQEKEVIVVDGASFDTASLVLGGYLDLGEVFMERLHLVPGVDLVLRDQQRTYSTSADFRYYFTQGGKTAGYAGLGLGAHILRSAFHGEDDVKATLNVPLGFQRSLGGSLLWLGELKLLIGDQANDSSFRVSVGLVFGKSVE